MREIKEKRMQSYFLRAKKCSKKEKTKKGQKCLVKV